MKAIKLTQGQLALVDDDDYQWLNQWKWHAHKDKSGNFYASRSSTKIDGKQHTIFMHRQILGLEFGDSRQVDHANHSTLDNRRSNIRLATSTQNNQNRIPFKSTSRFKGVSRHFIHSKGKIYKYWQAHIKYKGKQIFLGHFKNEYEAAQVYNVAARKYFGEYAYQNVICL